MNPFVTILSFVPLQTKALTAEQKRPFARSECFGFRRSQRLVYPSKVIQDGLGFWIPRDEFRLPFQGNLDSWIPDSLSKKVSLLES